MRIKAILNRDGGTLKTTDVEAFSGQLEQVFAKAGHEIAIELVSGNDLIAALDSAGAEERTEAILAGGGDGTISAAAHVAWTSGKALAVLPAGTMNLFARSLEVPLGLDDAVAALATAEVKDCDIATANGRSFVHQFSVGLQPRILMERDSEQHGSRLSKMLSGLSAAFSSMAAPPLFRADIACDGEKLDKQVDYSLIVVTNNPYGEAILPRADRLNRGVLGLYRARALGADAYLRLAGDLVTGSLNDSTDLDFSTARKVELVFPNVKSSARASIDGELIPLEREVKILTHPGELKVLAPTGEQGD